MSDTVKTDERTRTKQLADELRQNGYRVVIEPSLADMPFTLGSYRPDLIGFKDEGGLIIEVKTSHGNISVERFQEIAVQIAANKGWRFVLVTLTDTTGQIFPSSEEELPDWSELANKAKQITFLLSNHMLEPALVYLWGTVEATLRREAFQQLIPIDRFPANNLLNHMYSCGEISMSEHEIFSGLLIKRNKASHGLSLQLKDEDIEKPLQILKNLLTKWSNS